MSNIDFYQSFVSVDLASTCEQYSASGEFEGELGDLMVVTLANILQHPIVIFTSVSDMPVLCYTPFDCNNSSPLFLTYTQSGPGHYDYAVPKSQDNDEVANTKSIRCTCGRKRNSRGEACSILRCVCLRSGQACSHMCTCKFCTNSFGTHPPLSSTRRRVPYAAQ